PDLFPTVVLSLLRLAGERGQKLAARRGWPTRPLPRRSVSSPLDACPLVLERAEEFLPTRFHAAGILLEARLQVLDVFGVAAIKERAAGKGGIGFLARHAGVPIDGSRPGRGPPSGGTGAPHSLYYVIFLVP